MEDALNINELKMRINHKYDYDEKRIVGIMLARYDLKLTQSIINDCYLYWYYNSDKVFDIYWAGYGKFLCPDEENENKIILKFPGNKKRVYYDRLAFISIKNELNNLYKKPYQDKLQLVLVNYYDGKLHFKESIKIDLEENLDQNFATIREIIEFITNECSEKHDVTDLARKLRSEHIKDYFKNQIKGITLSDFISTSIGVASL